MAVEIIWGCYFLVCPKDASLASIRNLARDMGFPPLLSPTRPTFGTSPYPCPYPRPYPSPYGALSGKMPPPLTPTTSRNAGSDSLAVKVLRLARAFEPANTSCVTQWLSNPIGPVINVSNSVCATGIRSSAALKAATLPTKKFMHAMWSHALDAVTRLESSVIMPSSLGKNWGCPVASPSAKDPGIMRDNVSGDQDAHSRAR